MVSVVKLLRQAIRSRRAGPFLRGPLAAILLLIVPLAAAAGSYWTGRIGAREARPYAYPFERPERGSVRRALEAEIAFYQARLARNPGGGLDLAALAGAYLRMARATGDLAWYLLAEQTAQRSLAHLPLDNAAALLALARVAEARHDFAEAIRLARRAGDDGEALSILVTSHLARGDVDEAARAAAILVHRVPGLASHALSALVAEAQGKDDVAFAALGRAIAAEEPGEAGSSAWARTLLGRLHYRRGRLAQARDLYREALRILPQYPLALVNLAELEMRQGRYRSAERYIGRVATITRASPNVYDHAVLRGLARLHELQGNQARAAALWAEAEARLRRDVTTGQFGHRRELARLLLERGRPQDVPEAVALMEAEARVRQDAETLEVYARALAGAGRWGEARRAIARALHAGIRDARLFYRAATIAQALGHDREAQRLFGLMRQTDPTFDEQARRILGVEP